MQGDGERRNLQPKHTVNSRDNWNPTDHWFPEGLFFDGCACTSGIIEGTYIRAHCHRTNINECDCKYAGVHYSGDIGVADKVADYIANAYWCEVEVVEGVLSDYAEARDID